MPWTDPSIPEFFPNLPGRDVSAYLGQFTPNRRLISTASSASVCYLEFVWADVETKLLVGSHAAGSTGGVWDSGQAATPREPIQ